MELGREKVKPKKPKKKCNTTIHTKNELSLVEETKVKSEAVSNDPCEIVPDKIVPSEQKPEEKASKSCTEALISCKENTSASGDGASSTLNLSLENVVQDNDENLKESFAEDKINYPKLDQLQIEIPNAPDFVEENTEISYPNLEHLHVETPHLKPTSMVSEAEKLKLKHSIISKLNEPLEDVRTREGAVHHVAKEKVSSNNVIVKNLYPDVKSFERMESIESAKTLVQTIADKCLSTTHAEASKRFDEFMRDVSFSMERYPLFDLVKEFQNSRKKSTDAHSQMKSLNSKVKRKKNCLWERKKKETKPCTGLCEDGHKVTVTHTYYIIEMDNDKFKEVLELTGELSQVILSDAFYSYSDQVSKMKIEQYVYNLMQQLNMFDRASNFKNTVSNNNDVEVLRKCISILFHFQRQSTRDKEFLEKSQKWLSYMVSMLLRSTQLPSDYVFIVNHVIRCPNGIKTWASQLIQFSGFHLCVASDKDNFSCKCLYYTLLLLYLLVNPVPQKEQFLKSLETNQFVDGTDGKFTFLDSDGEEVEIFELVGTWTSEDIISLLNQIPLMEMYEHVLIENKNGSMVSKAPTDDSILRMFGFSNAVLNILFTGVETFCNETLSPVVDHVCGMIRQVVCFVTNHWTYCATFSFLDKSALQAEYDRFVFHAIFCLFNFQKLRVWNHLSMIPYQCVSKKMLWHILWIFHSQNKREEDVYFTKDVDSKLQDPASISAFVDKMKLLDKCDQLYLLHAYKSIAISGSGEEKLNNFIVHEIFELIFVESSLRHLSEYSTAVLVSIIEKYPKLLTVLLKDVQNREDDVIKFSTSLFKKLNLSEWIPTPDDIRIISDCLLLNSLASPINYLARMIMAKMNFGFTPYGELFLPVKLHQEIAILVLQSYMKFDMNGNEWSVSKGLTQIIQFATIQSSKGEDEGFVSWAWNLLFSLKLHILDQKHPQWVQIYDGYLHLDMPDPFNLLWLQPLLKAYEEKHPVACYLFLVMTNIGHNIDKLLDEGLKCLTALVEHQQYLATIHTLYYVLPFCVKHIDALLSKTQFISVMSNLVIADVSVLPNVTGEAVVGVVLHKIAAMIKHQISQASALTVECATPLLTLWVNILLKVLSALEAQNYKLKDIAKQVHFLLDVVLKISCIDSYTRNSMIDLLYTFGNPLLTSPSTTKSSFFGSFFKTNTETFTILKRLSIPDYPWLAWFILKSEIKQKHVLELWNSIQKQMVKDPNAVPFAILKKSSASLRIAEPALESLPIYRWAIQILQINASHPVLPLLYQQFFYYYFERVPVSDTQKPKSLGLDYFKEPGKLVVLKNLKKHAQDASEYYRERLQHPKDMEGADSKSDSGLLNSPNGNKIKRNVMEEMALDAELCKVFRAFYVWIDDKNLHLPSLCLSALDPKYCSARLSSVLNNDQKDWFELVSINRVKDELDLKVHSYTMPRSQSTSSQSSLESEDVAICEQASTDMTGHHKIEPLPNDIQLEPPLHQIDDKALFSSANGLLKHIEQNQNIIFEKARLYAQIESRLKKTNDDYKTLAPDEYIVSDDRFPMSKCCHKGVNCKGPAKFNLKIQKYATNPKVQAKLENIQLEQRALQSQLLNLPVTELCYASVLIENYIRALSNKLENGGEEAVKYRNMGISLFYNQIQSLNRVIMSVKSYSPSRNFFATSIETLGHAFILDQEDQLCDLAQAILNYPEAGELAFDLFNPNIASFSVFQDIYHIITSFVKHRSSNAIFVLLNKIDLKCILKTKKTNFDDRRKLFKKVCDTLHQCGSNPPEDLQMVYHTIRRHYRVVLSWMFPELYEDAVSFLLDGMETGRLSTHSWYDTFQCLGCTTLSDASDVSAIHSALQKVAENMLLPPCQQIFVSSKPINISEVQQTLNRVHEKFMSKRESQNLYQVYQVHVKPFGIFIGLLAHSMLSLLNDCTETNPSAQQQIINISQLWEYLLRAFHPWLHPEIKGQCFKFPWADEQINDAKLMFQIFTMCITNFHEKLLGYNCEKCILSYVWEFYVENYVAPDLRHYSVALCHSEMLNLPWEQFYPDSKDIEGMCTVLQSTLPESKEFLAKISLKIPWIDVMKEISTTKSPEYVRKTLGTLGKLLIISARWDTSLTKINPCDNNLKALEDLSWHFLSLEDTEGLLDLYYTNTDPNLMLNEEQASSPDVFIAQFLKIVCCMADTSNNLYHVHSNNKRLLYLRKYMTALSSCVSPRNSATLKPDKFKRILPSLLTDIDKIISKGVKPEEQMSNALPLVREVISFLNNITEVQLEAIVVQSVLSWLESKPRSPLLLPCLQTACQCLTHMSSAVMVVESCITVRFKTELHDSADAKSIWELIYSSFQIPISMTDEFVTACINKNALLALYCHIQVKMMKSTPENRKLLLVSIIDWMRRCDIKENDETKCLLLWDRVLELSIKLAFEDNLQVVKRALSSLCNDISLLGEDKSSSLLSGILGFGRPSTLSVNFRFLCRILSAFLRYQMPDNASIRLEPMASGFHPLVDGKIDTKAVPKPTEPAPSDDAKRAIENCYALLKNKHYSALRDLVNSAIDFILDPRNCLLESRQFLKSYAHHVFPKQTYLYVLS